jgi:hypothetical protein
MSTIITELLGKDPFSGSRIVINANFQALKSTLDDIETNFGLSILSGNIDISTAIGGQILAKTIGVNSIVLPASGTPNITLTGSSGLINAIDLVLTTSIEAPTAEFDNLTMSALGSSIFNGGATFNNLVKLYDGVARNRIDIGAVATHTVLNSDCTIIFENNGASPPTLTLTADPSLVDGHEITLVDKSSDVTTLISTSILGFTTSTIQFSGSPYKSAITLQWSVSDSKWFVTSSSNMTFI